MVIVCLDQTDTQFVEQCQKLGIDYLDISANSDFLKKVNLLPIPEKKQESHWFRVSTWCYQLIRGRVH